MKASLWELQIRVGTPGDYTFSLGPSNVGGLSQERIQVPTEIRDEILEYAQPPAEGADEGWLQEVGTLILTSLFPKSIQSQLLRLEGVHLAISTDDPEVPWEFVWTEQGCLARRVAVARRVVVESTASDVSPPERGRMEMLIVTNPTSDLEAAEREGNRIRDILAGDPLIRVTTLNREEATARRLFKTLRGSRFDVFHYAGHVTQRADGHDDEFQLELASGPVSARYLAGRFSVPPEIAFINGCQSGSSTSPHGRRVTMSANTRMVTGMAEAFLSAGVRSYVGTLWDVEDLAASRLATSFYQEVVAGATMGSALLKGREAVAADGPLAWAAYVLFGQPSDVLIGIEAAVERRRNLSRLREMLKSEHEGRRRRAAILLGELADPEATEPLVKALDDPSPAVAWRAVLGLAKIGTKAALEPLVHHLPTADPRLALHILIMLRERLSPEVSGAIRGLVEQTSDRVVRANALITLGGTSDQANLDFFAARLSDDDRLIQLLAVEGLGRIGSAALDTLYTYQPDDPALQATRNRVTTAIESSM